MEMAEWQRQILEERPAAFLRGLFRCQVAVTNESEGIEPWCGQGLDAVGIAWRQSNRTLSVPTREGVRLLDEHIGLKR
jgi:hypothetical protein